MKISHGLVAAILLFAIAASLHAQNSTWNSGTGGAWTTPENWTNGVPDSTGAVAYFNAGISTPTVTIDGTVTLASIIAQAYTGGTTGWILDGGTLDFDSGGSRNIYAVNASSTFGGTGMTIRSAVTSDGVLNLYGNSTTTNARANLRWEASSTDVARIDLYRAGISVDAVAGRLGTVDIWSRENGTSPNILANVIVLTNAADNPAVAGTFSNNLNLNTRGVTALRGGYAHNTQSWNINVTGIISETQVASTPANMSYYAGSNSAGGTRFVVSGNNSYTGNTVVGGLSSGPVIVRATHNNAFGTGTANVTLNAATDAVELSGGVTISDKTLQSKGGGYNNLGALNNISGNNQWDGNIELGGSEVNRIGVANASDVLSVKGVISGSQTLRKVGAGTLLLEEDNTFSGGFEIAGGVVRVDSAGALGTGTVSVGTLGFDAGLHINTGTAQATASNLILGDGAVLIFDLTGLTSGNTPIFSVAGNQTGTGTYTVEVLNASDFSNVEVFNLMGVAGTYEAANFVLGSSASPYGELTWDNGLLSYTVVPEPSSILLLILGLGAVLVYRNSVLTRRSNR